VRTRMLSPADVSPPYFNVGFPYAKDAFLSYAGTSWAVMALLTCVVGGPVDALCSIVGVSPLSGMVPMYLLMSAFHLAPWLKLIARRRTGVRNH